MNILKPPATNRIIGEDRQAQFCSGFGQYHSENNKKGPRPYLTIRGVEIAALAKNPPNLAKEEAQWVIFSTKLSRVHKVQRESGQFGAAWVDIDENPNGFQHVLDAIKRVFPGIRFISYLTKSAIADNQKCRIIIPLAALCPGEVYVLVQKVVNDRFEKLGILPDRKAETAGQICYLPNRGEHYQFHIEPGFPLKWEASLSKELAAERNRLKTSELDLAEGREQSQKRYTERMASGTSSPLDAYNEAYTVEDSLLAYGYKQHGTRYLSPNSASGSPGVSIKDGKWVSSHESDRLTIGTFGDAFDLFTFYEHSGNRTAALKAAGEMLTIDGVSLTKANQRSYMAGATAKLPTHYGADELRNPVIDKNAITRKEGTYTDQWDPSTPDWPTMDRKAYRGVAADFINLATRNSEADPAAILATFLVRFGVEIGPDVFMNVGDTKHRARLAAVAVGASSKARKGTSGKPVAKLFNFASTPGLNICNTARTSKGPFSSGEGIIYAIRDPATKWNARDQVEEIVDNGVEDKRLFVLDEEFGGVLANTKREGNTLSMIIRQAWDSGNFDPLTKNNKTTATGGHVGWVSHITLQELHAKLGESEGFNGFANRILWICAKRQKLVPLPQPMPEQELENLQKRLVTVLNKLDGGFEVKLGDQAKVAWCDLYYADLTKDRPGLVGCTTNRGEAQALRLAMIYCLLDGERIITLEHLEAGITFWDYCRQSANYIFHGRKTDNTAQAIVEALMKGPMSGTQVHALFNNHLSKERLETVLSELIASNQVILEKQEGSKGKGRPTKIYRFYETPCELSEISEFNSSVGSDEPIKFANSLNSQEDLSDSEVF